MIGAATDPRIVADPRMVPANGHAAAIELKGVVPAPR